MQRSAALLALAILAISLASCGGGNNNNTSTPKTLTLSPTPMTLVYGDALAITAKFYNGSDFEVFPTGVTYTSSDTSLASVDANGQVCAGTWDSKSIVCTPATRSGSATITVAGGGVSGSLTVYVHPRVDRIAISGSIDLANCKSIAAASPANQATLSASAWANGNDVTSQVGPFSWTVGNTAVATLDKDGKCTTDNTCLITAKGPGQTSVVASVSNGSAGGVVTTSMPGTFTSCPVQSLTMKIADTGATSVSLASAATQSVKIEAEDSKGNKLVDSNGALLSAVTPLYYSSQPLSASVTTSSTAGTVTVTAASAGTATTMIAACTSAENCNVNLPPVYSNAFTTKVNSSSTAKTTTVYVASTTGTSLIPVDTSTNTAGTAITLPHTPNSIAMARDGLSLYLGSSNGLMTVLTATGVGSTTSGVIGKVISISPDGSAVLVYNPPASAPGNGTLYIYYPDAKTYSSTTITQAGTTASASWAPDNSIAYVVSGTRLVTRPMSGLPHIYDAGQVNDVDFLAQGSFAYLAGDGADVTVRATCRSFAAGDSRVDSKDVGGSPAFIRSLPNATSVLALYPNDLSTAAQRYLNSITVSTTGAGCPPAVTNTPGSSPVQLGTFIPGQMLLTPDSSKVFITATDKPTVYVYDVAGSTVTSIALQGSGATGTYGGGLTLDGTRLYLGVAGSDKLHVIDTSTNTDTTQVSIGFRPDLVAVLPK